MAIRVAIFFLYLISLIVHPNFVHGYPHGSGCNITVPLFLAIVTPLGWGIVLHLRLVWNWGKALFSEGIHPVWKILDLVVLALLAIPGGFMVFLIYTNATTGTYVLP